MTEKNSHTHAFSSGTRILKLLSLYQRFFHNPLLPNGNYSYRIPNKISFLKKEGSWEIFPMSAVSMSR